MHRLALVLLLALAACGGVDPDFAGTWRGTVVYQIPGDVPLSAQGSFTLAADGDTLRASGICPNGSGSIEASGSGPEVTWTGDYRCAWPPGSACSTSVLMYNTITIILSGATVVARGEGVLAGCGYVFPIRTTFTGRK